MSRKANSLSVLKNLPPERQAEIIDRLRYKRPPEWPDNSHTAVRRWLKDDGIETSEAALSDFFSWYALQEQLRRNESTVESLLQKLQVARPDWTPEQIQQVGQSFFTALALEQQDPKQWFLIQQTALKKEQLALDRKKFQRDTIKLFLTWSADEEARKIATSNASSAEKTEKLGQRIFGELWE